MHIISKDISVIIPTYNRAGLLKSCLNHLINQNIDKGRYEIIVVDDGSIDHTPEIVRNYQQFGLVDIKYLKQSNKGPAAARNAGAMASLGDIIYFIDDDCFASEDALVNICADFKKLKAKEICVGGVKLPGKQNFIGQAIDISYGYNADADKYIYNASFLSTSNLAVSKKFFLEEGGFNESLRSGEDSEWCYRIREKGYRLIRSPKVVVCHQHCRNSLSQLVKQTFSWGLNCDLKIFAKYKNFLKKEQSFKERIVCEFYYLLIANPSLANIFIFVILMVPIALMETLSVCLSKLKNNSRAIILSPLLFIRCLSQQCGYLVYFLRQRRVKRHKNRGTLAQILFYNLHRKKLKTPPYLVFFVTNNCNASCEHCFYWEKMFERRGKAKEMTITEYDGLSRQLGFVEKISLTGGEPFLRDDLHLIAEIFYRNNHVKKIGITSNGILSEKIFDTVRMILELCPGVELGICFGLDGLRDTHDRLRGFEGAFDNVVNSYNMLKTLKDKRNKLNINLNFTLTNDNQEEFISLYEFVKKNMPDCWPLTFSLLRKNAREGAIIGRSKNPELELPDLGKIKFLARMILEDIKKENKRNFHSMLNEACFGHVLAVMQNKRQEIPCLAANIYAVVDELANVYFCDFHKNIGSLRRSCFKDIWLSDEAKLQREEIDSGKCFCCHNFFQDLNLKYQLCRPSIFIRSLLDYRAWVKK